MSQIILPNFNAKGKQMKPKLILTIILCLASIHITRAGNPDEIEFVESVPVETVLDLPDIRNTPEVWQEMLQDAKKSLKIETFYFSAKDGEPLDIILAEIRNAAKRGVVVQILSDARFLETYPEPLNSLNQEKNISVRPINFGELAGGVMHAKYFIVDDTQLFIGSQNFDWRALKHIHELGIRMRNQKLARIFSDLFDLDWQLAGQPGATPKFQPTRLSVPLQIQLPERQIPVVPVFSPKEFLPATNLWDEPRLVQLIDNAKTEINIQLLSYSPADWKDYYEVLDNALRRAATRNVAVKLMCSDWAKRKSQINFLKSLTVLPNIEVRLSTIPEYSGGFIPFARVDHCKYLLVDENKFWIGTSNWSKSYFYRSRNAGLIIEDPALAQQLHKFFLNSWNSPYAYPVDPCQEYEPPRRDK